MANLTNFKTNVEARKAEATKFMVSRVFDNGLNPILEIEEPATLPPEYSIEMSLYSLFDNSLIYTTTHRMGESNPFTARTLQYSGLEIRRLLFIDFSLIEEPLPIGEYEAVFYFFVPEIGDDETSPLGVTKISPSRSELELELLPEYVGTLDLLDFSRPQINSSYVMEAVGQIFGKTSGSIPSDNSVLVFDSIEQTLPDGLNNDVILELQEISTDILGTAYEATISQLESDLTSGKVRFTDMYLQELINTTITDAYTQYLSSSFATTKYTLPDINNT